MFLAFPRRGALGAVFLIAGFFGGLLEVGCSASSEGGAPAAPTSKTTAPTGFGFDANGVLQAAPKQDVTVGILVPGGDEDISVFLDGSYSDGSLAAGTVMSSGGRATVTLHAPSTMATFSMHAHTSRGEDARLDVAVSASGFANVTVTAKYAGVRTAANAIGSVFLGSTCADLASEPLHDGSPRVVGNVDAPFTIASVPAGAPFALSTRIGHYAAGCVDVQPLAATVARDVATTVYDLPMDLTKTDLDVTFQALTTNASTSGWSAILTEGSSDVSSSFFSGSNEATTLLDAMQNATPGGANGSNASQFHAARVSKNWSASTSDWLAAHTPSLHARALGWISDASAASTGDLTAHIAPGPSDGLANFTLVNFASFTAKNAGFSSSVAFGWVADSDDTVHLSGPVLLSPSVLVAAVADANAAAAVSGATDVASALAAEIDCAGFAASLVGGGVCYAGCDANCTGALCATALAASWQAARSASSDALHTATVDLAVSAKASVDDAAQPTAFAGSWSANVRSPAGNFSTGGTTTATTP